MSQYGFREVAEIVTRRDFGVIAGANAVGGILNGCLHERMARVGYGSPPSGERFVKGKGSFRVDLRSK